MKLGFVCVQNAGRSQMSAAFAEREREERGHDDIEILTGGTDPADEVHPEVVETMAEVEIDISDREPRAVSTAELNECDVVATMGCSTLSLDADTEVRDWALPDPDGESPERVREIREQVRERVAGLFDELAGERDETEEET
jgi:arsenate reductase